MARVEGYSDFVLCYKAELKKCGVLTPCLSISMDIHCW